MILLLYIKYISKNTNNVYMLILGGMHRMEDIQLWVHKSLKFKRGSKKRSIKRIISQEEQHMEKNNYQMPKYMCIYDLRVL